MYGLFFCIVRPSFVQILSEFVQLLFAFIQITSNVIPRCGGRGGGRGSEWEFLHGPWTHGQLPGDVDPDAGPLPPIDH